MRPSSALCGIRGIFPLIRTLAPQAVSPPFSLSSLRGLRLAIDATLLVQRLHFADDPHASRHVIGFYRLITSLHQNGVMPIMVFDHPQKRLALKDREQVKRRHKRELDRIRSRLEHERRGRLVELQSHLDALSELRESERRQVGELLDRWRAQSQQVLSEEQPSVEREASVAIASIPKTGLDEPLGSTGSSKPETVAYGMHTNWLQLEESLRSGGASQSKGQKVLAEAEKEVYRTIATQLRLGEAPQPLPPHETPDDIPLETTTEATSLPPSSHSLSSLNAMHHSLTKTYDRATSPLSASIYQDCATLSSLMSVPVFWTGDGTRTGGGRIHEAEAYAASLVRSGFADLVASEDSDVLLYEAPLLRGLMGGVRTAEGSRGKLEVICGTRARTRLFPRSDLEKLVHTHSSIRLDSTGDAEADSLYDRLTRSLMLDFALLCGTDFNRTIPGIGPKTALRLLKEHGSISTILRRESKKFAPPDGLSIREYETELRHARMVFLQPPKVRAAARSILGSAATEAATTREGLSESVERVLFGEDRSGVEGGLAENVDDASVGVDAVVNTYCTAEPAVEQGLSSVTTDAEAIVSVPLEPVSTTSTTPITTVTYDRQRVHDFLRSHGVFRTPHTHPDWALDTLDHTEPREQEWRDLLDLELGLSSPPTSPLTAEMNGILEAEDTEETSWLEMATLGADFFGERKAVACWQPHMEQQVRQGTNSARRDHVEP
ncbi:putative Flap endonuclease 1 (putative) [Pseudozyma hubeiensis]|nr:putative Flap endonuclease 1 (putative) [Pseudozyma hubeiensis]